MRTNRTLKYGVWGALCLACFLAYRGPLSHVLFYHEQHRLFLFSGDYLRRAMRSPAECLTDFLVQFFYHPLLGSALMALLLGGVYLLGRAVVKLLTGKEDRMNLSVLPPLALFFHTMSVDRSLTLVTGSAAGLFLLWAALAATRRRWLPLRLPFLRRLPAERRAWRAALAWAPLAVYAAGGYAFFLHTYNRSERIMLKAEQYAKAKDWPRVLDYTERYLDAGKRNRLVAYFHNLALYHAGRMPGHLFDYPQVMGAKALFFPWRSDSRESEYGHFLYEELGHLNEAHRWEFEAMVVWGETAPHLVNLARYNIAIGRPRVARRFINRLRQSLFYREEARRLEGWLAEGRVPGLRNALAGAEDERPARFANVLDIGPELEHICHRDSANRMAFEYLMSDLLLTGRVVRFAGHLARSRLLEAGAPLPAAYEEALYVCKLGVGEEEFRGMGLPVSPATEQRFRRYYQLRQAGQLRQLEAEFGRSYWFYLHYVSPHGHKARPN